MRIICTIFLIVLSCWMASHLYAVDTKDSLYVPISIKHDKGSFQGTLQIGAKGPLKKVSFKWNGSIQNTSPHKIHRAEFCVKAFGLDGSPFLYYGDECVIRLHGRDWGEGDALLFKGKQKIRINRESKAPVRVGGYEVSVIEIQDHAPNLRIIKAQCKFVWNPVIRAFADEKFHPTVIDKDSFTGSFRYSGGVITNDSDAKDTIRALTYAKTGIFTTQWSAFRIENTSVYLRDDGIDQCIAEVRISFAGYGKPFMEKLRQLVRGRIQYDL